MTKFNELMKLVDNDMKENSYIRYGQSLFNNLHFLDAKLANSIRGTKLDPFYAKPNSETIKDFFEFINENL